MSERNFREMLERKWGEGKFVCVGLDSDLSKIPQTAKKPTVFETMLAFNQAVVEATHDLICAFKPNIAFYAACGESGLLALKYTIGFIKVFDPEVPVILDFKRADIGNTNNGYVAEAFEYFGADAVTVNPYFGKEALKPFLDMKEKGIIVLCRTSNPGAGEFQDLKVGGYTPLYQIVAYNVAEAWNSNGNCAVVVGATCPEELAKVRKIVGDMPILIPGIGKQGGDVEKTVKAGKNSRGRGMMINSSRGIIFAENPREETEKLHNEIKKHP
jgi:orotidine-5'-phosphate decarboxylase